MTYSYSYCSFFFCVPMPYREHHFCQAPLSFVKHLGLDFFSSLAVNSKPLVFLWLTKNLSVLQPFLKARRVGISRLLSYNGPVQVVDQSSPAAQLIPYGA